jgi:magnesium-transporting ATPase (P-type)
MWERRSRIWRNQGIALKIITGDNDLVARHVAGLVGLQVDGVLTGDQMRKLTHPALVAVLSEPPSSPAWTRTRSSR